MKPPEKKRPKKQRKRKEKEERTKRNAPLPPHQTIPCHFCIRCHALPADRGSICNQGHHATHYLVHVHAPPFYYQNSEIGDFARVILWPSSLRTVLYCTRPCTRWTSKAASIPKPSSSTPLHRPLPTAQSHTHPSGKYFVPATWPGPASLSCSLRPIFTRTVVVVVVSSPQWRTVTG
jgi:hypothetical protein